MGVGRYGRTALTETRAGVQPPAATHPGKKYDVRGPPHSDYGNGRKQLKQKNVETVKIIV